MISVTDVDVVGACKPELAIRTQAEDRQPCRHGPHIVAIAHIHRQVVLRHQHAPAGIDVERARMNLLRFEVLDCDRFTGLLVDGIDDDAVLAAFVDFSRRTPPHPASGLRRTRNARSDARARPKSIAGQKRFPASSRDRSREKVGAQIQCPPGLPQHAKYKITASRMVYH